jgi:hypothetical protein
MNADEVQEEEEGKGEGEGEGEGSVLGKRSCPFPIAATGEDGPRSASACTKVHSLIQACATGEQFLRALQDAFLALRGAFLALAEFLRAASRASAARGAMCGVLTAACQPNRTSLFGNAHADQADGEIARAGSRLASDPCAAPGGAGL